tara:strand:+ start:44 stop:1267 length:1224 start_codon:yes stop_codon:yes gene_type:complete
LRIRLFTLLAIAISAIGFASSYGSWESVEGAVTITLLDVISVEGYRHVLTDDDRLILYTYAVVENIPTGDQSLGRTASIATSKVGGAGVKQQNPPVVGYSLGAFYWTAQTSSAMPFNDSSAVVSLETNPMLFANSMSDFSGVNWNSSNNLEDTAEELTDDLPALLRGLETANPDIDQGSYVSSRGITPLGMVLVGYAFPLLQGVAPDAFEISQTKVTTDDHSFKSLSVGGVAVPVQNTTFIDGVKANSTTANFTLPTRHFYPNTTSMTLDRAGTGDITSLCTLNQTDRVTVSCQGLASSGSASNVVATWYSATAGEDSVMTQDLKALGEGFGLPFNATRLLMVVVIMGATALMVKRVDGEPMTLVIFAGPILFCSALMGAMPMAIVLVILAMLLVAGSAPVFNRVFG